MTAIQILEKLGAEASLDSSQISQVDKEQINKLMEDSAFFNATLVHAPAEDDEKEKEKEEDDTEEAPEKTNVD